MIEILTNKILIIPLCAWARSCLAPSIERQGGSACLRYWSVSYRLAMHLFGDDVPRVALARSFE